MSDLAGPYELFRSPPRQPPAGMPRALSGLAIIVLVVVVVLAITIVRVALGSIQASSTAAKVDPAVVDITTNLAYEDVGLAGTGIVLSSSGEVLTNNHVIEGSATIKVTDVGNGRTYTAKVLGTDVTDDLALVKLEGASDLKTVRAGNSSKLSIGQAVLAIGNAGGTGGTPSVARGTVEALDTSIVAGDQVTNSSEHLTGLIETSAALEPGDSGGPLVDSSARVVGIDTAGSTSYQFESGAEQGFAIPIDKALSVADEIEAGRKSTQVHIGASAFLGVDVIAIPSVSGAFVTAVIAGSPAQAAGLGDEDMIVSIGGQSVDSPTALAQLMQSQYPGDVVQVRWVDPFGALQSASVHLVAGPPA